MMKTIILFLSAATVAIVGLLSIQNPKNAPLVQDDQLWLNACTFKLPVAQEAPRLVVKDEYRMPNVKIETFEEVGCCRGCIYDEGIGEELPEPVAEKGIEAPVKTESDSFVCIIYVEIMPQFPGGEKELRKFLAEHICYPKLARERGIEGKVVVSFVVNEDGSLCDFTILRDIGGGCGEAALAAVKQMPNWIPGKQFEKITKVKFSLPIKFTLEGSASQGAATPTSGPCAETLEEIPTNEPEEKAESKRLEVPTDQPENTLRLYPNPCHDLLTIESDDSVEQLVQIFDLNGKLCKRIMLNGLISIDVHELGAAGLYAVRVGEKTYKVVVE